MSEIKQVDMEYLLNALQKGSPKVKITPPILLTAEGNYTFFGREIDDHGTRTICASVSEREFESLLTYTNDHNKYIMEE